MKQTIGNACGTIALLHAIGNKLETVTLGASPCTDVSCLLPHVPCEPVGNIIFVFFCANVPFLVQRHLHQANAVTLQSWPGKVNGNKRFAGKVSITLLRSRPVSW
jgi:hypothetical protein